MKLFLRSDIAAAWQGADPFAAADALSGEILRVGPGRRTLRTTVGGQQFVAKLHHGVGWWEILKNLLLLRAPVLDAANEYRAAQRLSQAGVPSLTTAAFGIRGWNPAQRRSFILCDHIPHACSLEQTALQWRESPPLKKSRWAVIARVACIARAMHAAGVNHRDFYLCHFLCTTRDELCLIDLHRAQTRAPGRVPLRWRVKDLGSLYFSALDARLTERDLLRFVRHYNGGRLPRDEAQWRFWRAVGARAQRLYAKGRRLGIVADG